jgi:hypothetical protein
MSDIATNLIGKKVYIRQSDGTLRGQHEIVALAVIGEQLLAHLNTGESGVEAVPLCNCVIAMERYTR